MKTKLTASIISLLLCMPLCHAQQTIRLSGTVLEADSRQAAMYANIVLQTADFAFVAGASTNDKGAFRIDKISEGDYRLIVSAVGFKTNAIDLQGLSRSTDLGEILPEETTQQLDEVTVSAANWYSPTSNR